MMTTKQILNSPHYRSILVLTDAFDDGHGLRQMQYRWVLIRNHDRIKDEYFVSQMQSFFNEEKEIYKTMINIRLEWKYLYHKKIKKEKISCYSKLEMLYVEGVIKRDCITSKKNLSKFLHKLNTDYGLLEKIEKKDSFDGVVRYKLSKGMREKLYQYRSHCFIDGVISASQKRLNDYLWDFFSNEKLAKHIKIEAPSKMKNLT